MLGFCSIPYKYLKILVFQRFIQPPNPPKSKVPPNPEQHHPQPTPKLWYVAEVLKMTKVLEDGRENWSKINFPLRFLYVNFKNFSKISNLNWFFAKPRKTLLLGFLISYRIIISFKNSVKLALIFIKISIFKSEFAKNS